MTEAVDATAERSGQKGVRLAPYVPRLTANWAKQLGAGSGPQWRTLDATMVFGDVSGFTKMSERLARHGKVGAEEIADAINVCFDELLGVASRAGGSLLKFGGDAMLLLFDGEDHAVRGAQAAVGIRSRLREVGHLTTTAGQVTLRISIGVHTGKFNVFLVGGSHRELVVTGPGVTATVEAEGAATAGEIVMTGAAAASLPRPCRGPCRGNGFLLRAPGVARPDLAIEVVRMDDGEVALYVPVAIREHLMGGGADPVHRNAAVAFLHFDGTDEVIDREGEAHFAALLDTSVRRVQEIAEDESVTFLGTDVDHDGGKIILLSGAPRRFGDDEERILTALRRVVDSDLPLPMRVGVHSGPVFAGDVGPEYRRTFTVMGDTVNLAARLMAKAEPGQVIATAEVLERSKRTFDTKPLPPFMVKGKRHPINAFAVGDARRTRVRSHNLLPLLGVDDQLAAFDSAISSMRRGEGHIIEIVGDHGSGKSRLVEELRRRATGVQYIGVTCESYESTTPYAPFWMILRRVLRVGAETGRDVVTRRLIEAVERHAPELSGSIPLLGIPLEIDFPDSAETASLEPEFRRQAADQAITTFLSKALPDPVLVVIEDVHHMDEASQGLLRRVMDLFAERSALLCLTRRDTGTGFVPDHVAHLDAHHLTPWPLNTAVEALTQLTEDTPVLPQEIRVIAERAGGNPLFLEELWRARVAGGSMESLPDSVDTAITAQIDRLPPVARQTLRSAAVLGTTFLERDLSQLLLPEGGSSEEGQVIGGGQHLSGLEDFLITDGSGMVRFRSAMVRECAYQELPFRRRRELHGRAGEAILTNLGSEADTEAEVLSMHFFHAETFHLAWHFARVAGTRAATKYANLDAATHFEGALAAGRKLSGLPGPEMASVWVALGDARERAGSYDEAAVAYRNARKLLATNPVAVAELCLKEAWIPERVGAYSEAVRWIRRGLKAVEGSEGTEAGRKRAQLTVWYATVRQAQGRHREAVACCERAIEEARTFGDRDAEAHALYILDWAWTSLGRSDLCTNSQAALDIYTELGDVGGQAVVLNNLGVFAYFRGDWDEAVRYYERGRDARLATGNEIDAAFGTCNIGEILANQGHFEEAAKRFREGLQIFRASRYRYGVGYTLLLSGQLSCRVGSFEDARKLLGEARREFEASGLATEIRLVDVRTAECLLLESRLTDSLEIANGLLASAKADQSAELPLLQRVRGHALLELEDTDGAAAALSESLRSAEEQDASYEVALTLSVLARLARLRSDETLASESETRSKEILDRLGVVAEPVTSLAQSLRV